MIIKDCPNCGVVFRAHQNRNKFCCQSCAGKYNYTLAAKGMLSSPKCNYGNGYWLGKNHSEETICIFRDGRRKGDENYNWRGGLSFLPYPKEFNKELKSNIKDRDGSSCQVCGRFTGLSVHHKDYNKENNDRKNLITLCHSCHSRTNGNRSYWSSYLGGVGVVSEIYCGGVPL
jgi:uncharacterized C2H2 Zn-finger protein